MIGGNFRDHLAVIGGRAEHLRVERDRRNRLASIALANSAVAISGRWYADLVEALERREIVPAAAPSTESTRFLVLRRLARSCCDDQDIVRGNQGALGPSPTIAARRARCKALVRSVMKIESKRIGAEIIDPVERRRRRQQAEMIRAFRQQASTKAVSTRSGENTASAMPCAGSWL